MANNSPRRNSKDIEELESAFNKLSDNDKSRSSGAKYASSDNRITTVLIICICILSVAVIIGGILIFTLNGGNKVDSDFTILGVNVKGMSRGEAVDAISGEFSKLYAGNSITVSIDGTDIQITPDISNVSLDAQEAVKAAIKEDKNATSFDLTPYITFEKASVRQLLEDAAPAFTSTLTQSQAEVVGTAPVDLLSIDENASLTLKITKGTPGKKLDMNILLDRICNAYSTGKSTVTYEIPVSEPDPVDLAALRAEYCSEPVEGEFEEKTFKILGGTYGYAFDDEAVNTAVGKAEPGDIIEIPFSWTKPEKSAEDLNGLLFRDKLSTYTTKAGSQGNRDTNIELASAAINGYILYPGDVFSYNGVVGERTPEKGYKPGATYVNGETVMTYGGGICQVSTTLYYCTVVADLEVVERECHLYASSYTPLSTDATVYWGGID
ncbi:MAG: VanW family protein [Oscillospiraceae bacterium]|nr:VanW family protein [Oscillospiraceae bacterium]